MALHAECPDCHNPHAVKQDPPMISFNPSNPSDPNHFTPPDANGRIKGVKGIDLNGAVKSEVDYQYELCFKCHGVPGKSACGSSRCPTASSFQMTRQDGVYNIRDKVNHLNPALVSYHPITQNNPANDTEVPSLRTDVPLNRTTSLIYCTDCHSSDTSSAAGGAGPDGPHGSSYGAILAKQYTFNPEISYSTANYDLCFKCHDESSILNDVSGFPHSRHLGTRKRSCINCHDPHGSHRFAHLLNFLTYAVYGGTTYQITGQGSFTEPTWQDLGTYQGQCYLNCHGVKHSPKSY
jgi:hypothetical protein